MHLEFDFALLSFGPAKESDPGAERTECEQGYG
jgi:hypothetical protein